MNGKLIGQKETSLNIELFMSNWRIQLRKRGIHPNMIEKQKYNDFLSKGKSFNLNIEQQMEAAKQDARKETLRLQELHPVLNPDIERYQREFEEHVRSLEK